uniref:Uncharacterized protein n=1 Tax=Chromera velia CCMP2878 TaxID=1169474 RepID=A0A0K6S779_9ALVE|eukprot:Cvel_4390.t3-p1 / transcript=Cvel_4390.t3 / gene=Cvel_4390 / organism=Chromera_velia_CCMP2878 / gene_product=hypothetical protein / transcript_product=hypothetical protein / location=Cvel_scaffold190:78147-88392(-) / protein_length=2911 / sequence_SO=supercontig / SO=protein_coding / is_pseudo=false
MKRRYSVALASTHMMQRGMSRPVHGEGETLGGASGAAEGPTKLQQSMKALGVSQTSQGKIGQGAERGVQNVLDLLFGVDDGEPGGGKVAGVLDESEVSDGSGRDSDSKKGQEEKKEGLGRPKGWNAGYKRFSVCSSVASIRGWPAGLGEGDQPTQMRVLRQRKEEAELLMRREMGEGDEDGGAVAQLLATLHEKREKEHEMVAWMKSAFQEIRDSARQRRIRELNDLWMRGQEQGIDYAQVLKKRMAYHKKRHNQAAKSGASNSRLAEMKEVQGDPDGRSLPRTAFFDVLDDALAMEVEEHKEKGRAYRKRKQRRHGVLDAPQRRQSALLQDIQREIRALAGKSGGGPMVTFGDGVEVDDAREKEMRSLARLNSLLAASEGGGIARIGAGGSRHAAQLHRALDEFSSIDKFRPFAERLEQAGLADAEGAILREMRSMRGLSRSGFTTPAAGMGRSRPTSVSPSSRRGHGRPGALVGQRGEETAYMREAMRAMALSKKRTLRIDGPKRAHTSMTEFRLGRRGSTPDLTGFSSDTDFRSAVDSQYSSDDQLDAQSQLSGLTRDRDGSQWSKKSSRTSRRQQDGRKRKNKQTRPRQSVAVSAPASLPSESDSEPGGAKSGGATSRSGAASRAWGKRLLEDSRTATEYREEQERQRREDLEKKGWFPVNREAEGQKGRKGGPRESLSGQESKDDDEPKTKRKAASKAEPAFRVKPYKYPAQAKAGGQRRVSMRTSEQPPTEPQKGMRGALLRGKKRVTGQPRVGFGPSHLKSLSMSASASMHGVRLGTERQQGSSHQFQQRFLSGSRSADSLGRSMESFDGGLMRGAGVFGFFGLLGKRVDLGESGRGLSGVLAGAGAEALEGSQVSDGEDGFIHQSAVQRMLEANRSAILKDAAIAETEKVKRLIRLIEKGVMKHQKQRLDLVDAALQGVQQEAMTDLIQSLETQEGMDAPVVSVSLLDELSKVVAAAGTAAEDESPTVVRSEREFDEQEEREKRSVGVQRTEDVEVDDGFSPHANRRAFPIRVPLEQTPKERPKRLTLAGFLLSQHPQEKTSASAVKERNLAKEGWVKLQPSSPHAVALSPTVIPHSPSANLSNPRGAGKNEFFHRFPPPLVGGASTTQTRHLSSPAPSKKDGGAKLVPPPSPSNLHSRWSPSKSGSRPVSGHTQEGGEKAPKPSDGIMASDDAGRAQLNLSAHASAEVQRPGTQTETLNGPGRDQHPSTRSGTPSIRPQSDSPSPIFFHEVTQPGEKEREMEKTGKAAEKDSSAAEKNRHTEGLSGNHVSPANVKLSLPVGVQQSESVSPFVTLRERGRRALRGPEGGDGAQKKEGRRRRKGDSTSLFSPFVSVTSLKTQEQKRLTKGLSPRPRSHKFGETDASDSSEAVRSHGRTKSRASTRGRIYRGRPKSRGGTGGEARDQHSSRGVSRMSETIRKPTMEFSARGFLGQRQRTKQDLMAHFREQNTWSAGRKGSKKSRSSGNRGDGRGSPQPQRSAGDDSSLRFTMTHSMKPPALPALRLKEPPGTHPSPAPMGGPHEPEPASLTSLLGTRPAPVITPPSPSPPTSPHRPSSKSQDANRGGEGEKANRRVSEGVVEETPRERKVTTQREDDAPEAEQKEEDEDQTGEQEASKPSRPKRSPRRQSTVQFNVDSQAKIEAALQQDLPDVDSDLQSRRASLADRYAQRRASTQRVSLEGGVGTGISAQTAMRNQLSRHGSLAGANSEVSLAELKEHVDEMKECNAELMKIGKVRELVKNNLKKEEQESPKQRKVLTPNGQNILRFSLPDDDDDVDGLSPPHVRRRQTHGGHLSPRSPSVRLPRQTPTHQTPPYQQQQEQQGTPRVSRSPSHRQSTTLQPHARNSSPRPAGSLNQPSPSAGAAGVSSRPLSVISGISGVTVAADEKGRPMRMTLKTLNLLQASPHAVSHRQERSPGRLTHANRQKDARGVVQSPSPFKDFDDDVEILLNKTSQGLTEATAAASMSTSWYSPPMSMSLWRVAGAPSKEKGTGGRVQPPHPRPHFQRTGEDGLAEVSAGRDPQRKQRQRQRQNLGGVRSRPSPPPPPTRRILSDSGPDPNSPVQTSNMPFGAATFYGGEAHAHLSSQAETARTWARDNGGSPAMRGEGPGSVTAGPGGFAAVHGGGGTESGTQRRRIGGGFSPIQEARGGSKSPSRRPPFHPQGVGSPHADALKGRGGKLANKSPLGSLCIGFPFHSPAEEKERSSNLHDENRRGLPDEAVGLVLTARVPSHTSSPSPASRRPSPSGRSGSPKRSQPVANDSQTPSHLHTSTTTSGWRQIGWNNKQDTQLMSMRSNKSDLPFSPDTQTHKILLSAPRATASSGFAGPVSPPSPPSPGPLRLGPRDRETSGRGRSSRKAGRRRERGNTGETSERRPARTMLDFSSARSSLGRREKMESQQEFILSPSESYLPPVTEKEVMGQQRQHLMTCGSASRRTPKHSHSESSHSPPPVPSVSAVRMSPPGSAEGCQKEDRIPQIPRTTTQSVVTPSPPVVPSLPISASFRKRQAFAELTEARVPPSVFFSNKFEKRALASYLRGRWRTRQEQQRRQQEQTEGAEGRGKNSRQAEALTGNRSRKTSARTSRCASPVSMQAQADSPVRLRSRQTSSLSRQRGQTDVSGRHQISPRADAGSNSLMVVPSRRPAAKQNPRWRAPASDGLSDSSDEDPGNPLQKFAGGGVGVGGGWDAMFRQIGLGGMEDQLRAEKAKKSGELVAAAAAARIRRRPNALEPKRKNFTSQRREPEKKSERATKDTSADSKAKSPPVLLPFLFLPKSETSHHPNDTQICTSSQVSTSVPPLLQPRHATQPGIFPASQTKINQSPAPLQIVVEGDTSGPRPASRGRSLSPERKHWQAPEKEKRFQRRANSPPKASLKRLQAGSSSASSKPHDPASLASLLVQGGSVPPLS